MSAVTPDPEPASGPRKKPLHKRAWFWLLVVLAVIALVFAGCAALVTGAVVGSADTTAEQDPPAAAETSEPAGTAAQELTPERTAAVDKAREYLNLTALSRQGVIDQLVFEKFPADDATFAADAVGVDYTEQAERKAGEYAETTSLSRGELVDQLVFDGFTAEQAAAGADAASAASAADQ